MVLKLKLKLDSSDSNSISDDDNLEEGDDCQGERENSM